MNQTVVTFPTLTCEVTDITMPCQDVQNLDRWLQRFAYFLGGSWPSLAKKLDFSYHDIENIKRSTFPGPMERQALHMLMTWKNKYVCGNIVGKLKHAVRQMKRHDLLRKLGEDVLDDDMVAGVATQIDSYWPVLATFLGFKVHDIHTIEEASSDVVEQAKTMIASWREYFAGDDQVLHLALALSNVKDHDRSNSHKRERVEPPLGREPRRDFYEDTGFGILNAMVGKALAPNVTDDECGANLDTESSEVNVEGLLENIPIVEQGVVVVQKGIACFHRCKKALLSWKDGKLSKDEFIRSVVEPVTSMVKVACKTGCRIIGAAVGGTLCSLIPVVGQFLGPIGASVGFIFGGKLASFIGKKAAAVVDRPLSRLSKRITNKTVLNTSLPPIKPGKNDHFESGKTYQERVRSDKVVPLPPIFKNQPRYHGQRAVSIPLVTNISL